MSAVMTQTDPSRRVHPQGDDRMTLAASTKIHDLLQAHPFLEDFLASYNARFQMLRNRMARATIGRVATLRTAAGIAGIDLEALLRAIATEIERHTGQRPPVELAQDERPFSRDERLQELQAIIRDLHHGGDPARAQERFARAVEDVEASEIAAMEEELIRGGLPVSEVQRLCDVHVGAFRQALDGHQPIEAPAGHPVHTYVADNALLTKLANRLGALAREGESSGDADARLEQAAGVLQQLGGLENHYQRKENELFPLLERHGITGPSQVMWGVHDEIRASLKGVRAAVEQGDVSVLGSGVPALTRAIVEMIYKEEKILFPLAMQTLSDEEWAEVRRGEDVLGYALAQPAAAWPALNAPHSDDPARARQSDGSVAPASPASIAPTDTAPVAPTGTASVDARIGLTTGGLSLEQVNLIFTHLPVDLSFVDENDTVRFYSEGPHRIFPRSPGVIGRKVQGCHPPKSVHMVQEILDAFRSGKQSVAEFWIQMHGRFIHIRYIAIRDTANAYRGCLEVSQDVTAIRALEGQRRLLDWKTE